MQEAKPVANKKQEVLDLIDEADESEEDDEDLVIEAMIGEYLMEQYASIAGENPNFMMRSQSKSMMGTSMKSTEIQQHFKPHQVSELEPARTDSM